MGIPLPLLTALFAVLFQDLLVGPALPSEARQAPRWLLVCLAPAAIAVLLRITLERGLRRGRLPGNAWRGLVLSLSTAPAVAFVILIFLGRWDVFVRARIVPGGEFLDLLLILAPFLVAETLVRWVEEGIARRLRSLGFGGMHWFGLARLRDMGLLLCVLVLPLLWDLLRLHPEIEVALDEITAARWAIVGGFFVLFAFFLADVFCALRGVRRLPAGSLRQRLADTAATLGFRFRDIMVWNTGGEVTNAAVVGPLAARRYVVLTDRLISTLDEEAQEAVFAHEAGHALRHHGLHLLALFVVLPGLLLSALERGDLLPPDTGPPWWVALAAGVVAIFVLRVVCHRFEIEADLFAAAALGGVEPCVEALELLAGEHPHMRNKSSFRHPSLGTRIAKLERAAVDPVWFRNWRRRGFALLMTGYLVLGALLGLEFHRLARVTPLDITAFQVFTARLAAAERQLPGTPAPVPATEAADLSVAETKEAGRRELLRLAIQMIRSSAPPETPRTEVLRRLRILAPRRAVRALEIGDVRDATDWLELAVSIGGARREVVLLRHLCLALRAGERADAEYYRDYLLDEHVLGEGRLRDAVARLDPRR